MAVTFADILQPKGEIEPQLFPHLADVAAVQARITEYLAEGLAKATALAIVDVDTAVRHWGHYRCYQAAHQRLVATPSDARIDAQGSRRYDPRQADALLALANQHKAAFDALVPPAASTVVPRNTASFWHRNTV